MLFINQHTGRLHFLKQRTRTRQQVRKSLHAKSRYAKNCHSIEAGNFFEVKKQITF